MHDIERLDLPSASEFGIVAACPGQPNLKREVKPQFKEVPDPDQERGTRIHLALQKNDSCDLSEEEAQDYESLKACEKSLVNGWLAHHRSSDGLLKEQPREQRLWINDQSTLKPILSGQLDKHFLIPNHALVIDFKTGWNTYLTPSERNFQLRVQGVLVWREYNDIQTVRVCFAKTRGKEDFTDYSENDLIQSEQQIQHLVWLSTQPDAPRNAGNHCAWCSCKPYCLEAGSFSLLPSVNNGFNDPMSMVAQLSPLDLALIWERSTVIEKILAAVKTRLKGFDEADLKSLGIRKAPGRNMDPIVKTEEAFEALGAFGISEQALWAALSFSKGNLVEAVMRDQNWSKAQTETWLKQMLAPMIEKKRSAEYLEKIK